MIDRELTSAIINEIYDLFRDKYDLEMNSADDGDYLVLWISRFKHLCIPISINDGNIVRGYPGHGMDCTFRVSLASSNYLTELDEILDPCSKLENCRGCRYRQRG